MNINQVLLSATFDTLLLLLISGILTYVFGSILGILLYLWSPQGLKPNRVGYLIVNGYVNLVRSIPFIIFMVLLIPVTRFIMGSSLGVIPATFPITLVGVALFARFVEMALHQVPTQTVDIGVSMGASTSKITYYFLWKESQYGIISGFTSTLLSLVSYSTVVGAIGGGGLGDFAIRYGYQLYDYKLMIVVVGILLVLVLSIQWMGNTLALKYKK